MIYDPMKLQTTESMVAAYRNATGVSYDQAISDLVVLVNPHLRFAALTYHENEDCTIDVYVWQN